MLATSIAQSFSSEPNVKALSSVFERAINDVNRMTRGRVEKEGDAI
jgi:hypothetical protein